METVDPTVPVALHLYIRVREGCEAKLMAFLRHARHFYEAPGGIRVRLLRDATDPRRFVEIIEYEDEAAFQQDDHRANTDPTMRRHLDEWRSLLDGEIHVKKYQELTAELGG